MATDAVGVIRDDETLTIRELAKRLGRKERWVKDTVRNADLIDLDFADLGCGLLLISGRDFRLSIETLASRQGSQREDESSSKENAK